MLLLDESGLLMADLATGDIRRYESGPPVSVPMVSDRFDLGSAGRIQIQITRDPRPTSTAQPLIGIDINSAGTAVDVRILPSNLIEIVGSGRASPASVTAPAGGSPAFVMVVEYTNEQMTVSVRNADTLDSTSLIIDVADPSNSVVTIGGPSDRSGSAMGRRRSVPVLIDVQKPPTTVDQVTRLVSGIRRLVSAARQRVT